MLDVDRARFEDMVADAIDALPAEFADRIANLSFAVEDWATHADRVRSGIAPNATLLGVYRGVPLPRRGAGYNMALPDIIVIFQGPLQRMAADEADLAARVRHVVFHEVAHYFGITDERLHEIGAY
jgi:predicted Zn-dependent protease with MMP-like domain